MGKLQKKKPVGKNKKKKLSGDGAADSLSANGAVDNRAASLPGVARDKKKPVASYKKSTASARSAKIKEGHIENVLQFLREVKIELKKVTWPTRAQAMGSTVVVIVLVIIISLFLGLVDGGLSSLVRIVLH